MASSKKSLHSLTRRQLTSTRAKTGVFRSSIQAENDRTAAIVLGTAIDVTLEAAIKTRLRRLRVSEQETIFAGTGPLSTFSAKIQIGYALGLYGPQTRHDLIVIKDIRNVMAHSANSLTFRNKVIRNKCGGMHLVQRQRKMREPEYAEYATPLDEFKDACHVYYFLIGMIAGSRSRQKFLSAGMGDLAY